MQTAAAEEDGVPPSSAAPARLYYGWVLVGVLAVTETVSYGVLQYAFPVFLAPMHAELGWSRTAMTGAFSLASLVSGFTAVPAGRWMDRHGARGLMTAGSLLSALLLLAWAATDSLAAFYAIWAGLGVAMAAVLYEPAFAVVASWFHRLRGRALTLLTFVAGFASVIFVPLATWLVEAYEWRRALVWLAAILAATTILPHAILLRRHPRDLGLLPDGGAAVDGDGRRASPVLPSVSADVAIRGAPFRWLTLAFALSSLATTAVAVHLIPLLLERGYTPAFAGAALGAIGLMALPGRLIFTPLGGRWPRAAVTASIFLMQALGIAALLTDGGEAWVWACVVLFGAGFGAITPARAALLAEFYGPREYGRISGVLAMYLALARAAAPVGGSLLYAIRGGYGPVLWALLAACLAAAAAVLLAGSHPQNRPTHARS
ncbi:MAG TPA: MFS transporter [Longimicrobium sp.]|jgi:MFS family permease|uniref:MFS transporter n=1 Tax=Longimicrobium sp. TaxID=2029185 RepID=UPI002ED893FD